ncbi:organic cation/carnitine transporter 2-like [Carex rostrata]
MTSSSILPIDNSPDNAPSFTEVPMEKSSPSELLLPLLVAFAWAFDAQQNFISVFADADPTWRCLKSTDQICKASSNPCNLRPDSWAWVLPPHSSTISEWALNCSGKILSSLPTSSFFAGCLIGGLLLTTLADTVLGRKKLLVLSCLIMSVAGGLAALSPNIWVYCILRFLSGFGRSAVGTCSFVLSSEIARKKWRGGISVSCFFFFALGLLSLSPLAYAGRRSSWRMLYLWTCVPAFCYAILIHFIVPESPRWLSMQEHTDKAKRYSEAFSSMKELVTTRSTLLKLLAIMMAGFGMGMVFYGMPLLVGSIAPNLYLSMVYNAVADLPASVATYFLLVHVKRRMSLVALTMLSGIASLLCVFRGINSNVQLSAEVISFLCACMAVTITMVYSVEVFPTCVRNSAVSMVREAVYLGAVLAPILVAEGRRRTRLLSFGVFGIVVCCCGLFVIFLPETKGKDLSDNMDEENQNSNTNIVP